MSIPLVTIEECVNKGGKGRTKGEKYGKYTQAIAPHIQWIKDQIANSKDGTIRVKVKDLAETMGAEFTNKKYPTSLVWALKYVLFNEGLFVDSGTHRSGDKLVVIRNATTEDKLPPSLSKYIDDNESDDE